MQQQRHLDERLNVIERIERALDEYHRLKADDYEARAIFLIARLEKEGLTIRPIDKGEQHR
jgi:hypothetical protein